MGREIDISWVKEIPRWSNCVKSPKPVLSSCFRHTYCVTMSHILTLFELLVSKMEITVGLLYATLCQLWNIVQMLLFRYLRVRIWNRLWWDWFLLSYTSFFSPLSYSFAFSFAFLHRHCWLSFAFSWVFFCLLTSFWLLKLLFLLGLCAVAFCIPDEHLFPGTFHLIS